MHDITFTFRSLSILRVCYFVIVYFFIYRNGKDASSKIYLAMNLSNGVMKSIENRPVGLNGLIINDHKQSTVSLLIIPN